MASASHPPSDRGRGQPAIERGVMMRGRQIRRVINRVGIHAVTARRLQRDRSRFPIPARQKDNRRNRATAPLGSRPGSCQERISRFLTFSGNESNHSRYLVDRKLVRPRGIERIIIVVAAARQQFMDDASPSAGRAPDLDSRGRAWRAADSGDSPARRARRRFRPAPP